MTRLNALLLLLGFALAGCESSNTSPTATPSTAAPLRPNSEASVASTPGPAPSSPVPVVAPEPPPIDMGPAGSKPISFQRVMLTMQTGEHIGKLTAGWLHIPHSTLTATPGEGSKQFNVVAREELLKAHYTIPGADNQLFAADEAAKARYQLGAEIPHIELDVHVQPGWANASVTSNGMITVNWQLYDTLAQKVIFKKLVFTPYHNHTTLDLQENEIFEMFRGSLRTLLAQQEFAALLRPDAAEPKSDKGGGEPTLTLTASRTAGGPGLPEGFPAVMESFVAIEPGSVLGSGFIVSPDGYLLTAAHVVAGLKTVPVRLHGGIVLEAAVVRLSENADIALLKLPGSSFKSLPLASGAKLAAVGSEVYAVGNPAEKELNASVSRGVVSGNREIDGRKYIQTDAAANPGSSGGPLLDKAGNVLGVISWKFAGPQYQGLAFAVPVEEALAVLHVALAP